MSSRTPVDDFFKDAHNPDIRDLHPFTSLYVCIIICQGAYEGRISYVLRLSFYTFHNVTPLNPMKTMKLYARSTQVAMIALSSTLPVVPVCLGGALALMLLTSGSGLSGPGRGGLHAELVHHLTHSWTAR